MISHFDSPAKTRQIYNKTQTLDDTRTYQQKQLNLQTQKTTQPQQLLNKWTDDVQSPKYAATTPIIQMQARTT